MARRGSPGIQGKAAEFYDDHGEEATGLGVQSARADGGLGSVGRAGPE